MRDRQIPRACGVKVHQVHAPFKTRINDSPPATLCRVGRGLNYGRKYVCCMQTAIIAAHPEDVTCKSCLTILEQGGFKWQKLKGKA